MDQIDLSFHLGQGMHHSLEDHDRILHFKRFFGGLPLGFLLTTIEEDDLRNTLQLCSLASHVVHVSKKVSEGEVIV